MRFNHGINPEYTEGMQENGWQPFATFSYDLCCELHFCIPSVYSASLSVVKLWYPFCIRIFFACFAYFAVLISPYSYPFRVFWIDSVVKLWNFSREQDLRRVQNAL